MSYPATPTTPTTPSAALPRAVQLARTLVFTLVGLLALRTLLSIIWADNLIDAYVGDRQTNSEFVDEAYLEALRDGAPEYTIIAIVSLILFGGLLLLAAVKFADRAGWARIVAIVMGILAALGGLLVLAQPAPLWYVVFGLVIAAVAITSVVVLFGAEARAWFRRTPA